MIETILMALPLAATIHIARGNMHQVRTVWAAARWYERCRLLLLFVPIPGPIDEIVAVLVIKRVAKRLATS